MIYDESSSFSIEFQSTKPNNPNKYPQQISPTNIPNNYPQTSQRPAYGEILVVSSKEDMCALSDQYAAEHLEVQVSKADEGFYLEKLRNYGSMFLGEETCVTYGDKASGISVFFWERRLV